MPRPDTKNAHVRRPDESRRQAPDVQADEGQRLLDDPAFIRGFGAVRDGLLRELIELKHDGQPETDMYEREVCRSLRTLHSLKRAISLGVQGQRLRLANFRGAPPEESDVK